MKAAECLLRKQEKDEACSNFVEASKCYKKSSPQGMVLL